MYIPRTILHVVHVRFLFFPRSILGEIDNSRKNYLTIVFTLRHLSYSSRQGFLNNKRWRRASVTGFYLLKIVKICKKKKKKGQKKNK